MPETCRTKNVIDKYNIETNYDTYFSDEHFLPEEYIDILKEELKNNG